MWSKIVYSVVKLEASQNKEQHNLDASSVINNKNEFVKRELLFLII